MSEHVRSTRCRPSGNRSRRWITLTTIVAMLGFAGLVFADSGNNKVHRIGPASKIAKPIAVNDEGPGSPTGDNTPPTGDLNRAAAPANDTCAGALPLALNRVVLASTVGAADDYQSPATAACFAGIGQTPTTAPGRDVVFTFQAPAAGTYSIRIIQQGPNDDSTRVQNAVLYASDNCPSSGVVNCLAGANRPQSGAFISSTGSASNQSEEIYCMPLTAGQQIYVFLDDASVAGTPQNTGSNTSLEVTQCITETEPNNSIAAANAYQCQIEGSASVGAVAHCYLGTRAGNVCTRSTPLDQSFAVSHKICSITGVPCTVDSATGMSTCAGGPTDYCQQQTDLDCDPRCDAGPNVGLSCTTNAFCNPGSDQGAVCAGTCQPESVCVDAAGNPGIACTPVCVGGLFPGRYCSTLSGCPGGGVCTVSAMCPAGSVCSRQFNEGDADFFSLGTPVAGSKVFATVDAKATNENDFRMRINSPTQTLQFDDDDGIGRSGANAPVIAGALTTGTETFVQVSMTAARASEPYVLNAIVRGPLATAQLEAEDGPTGNDIYYGWPGDVINANAVTNGGYVKGTFAFNGDSDCFKFFANEGDLMDWYGDGNPTRTAGVTGIVNIPWPIIYDAGPAAISNFIFGMSPGRRNINAATQAVGLNNTSPAVGPPGHLQWRAEYTGMMEVCYYDDSAAIGLGTPNHPGAWAGSLSVGCGPVRNAGPGATTTDVAVTKTVSAGPHLTGSFATYTITVTNSSADIAQEVTLIDQLPPEVSFVSLTIDDTLGGNNTACFLLPTPGTADNPIYCINTSMAPGTSTVYTVTVQVNNCIGSGLTISNTATISTVSTDPDPSNDSATATFDTTEDGSCSDLACDTSTCVENLCTNNDHCEAGVCVSTAVDCNDNSLCTDDSCDPAVGCINDPSQAGDLCEDFNPCTTNACDPLLFCVFPPAPTSTSCDDGLTCTTADHCDGAGSCTGNSVCDDGNGCTDDFADEANACACSHAPSIPGTACNDNNACTGTGATPDTCDGAGLCVGGQTVDCNDNDACTNDSCDPAVGCVHTAVTCDDGNACTTDSCDPALGCVFTNNSNPCDDGNACTQTDVCSGGACVGGNPVICTASDQCHDAGTCDAGTGTCSDPAKADGTACDDGDANTTGDVCTGGVCAGGGACNITPKPKSAGYYKKLCKDGHSHPYHGDELTAADAACVAGLTSTFSGISTVDDICNVIEQNHHNGPAGDGPGGKECDKGEDELMALALNICRHRVCIDQEVDSHCSGDGHDHTLTTVAASLATVDGILSDPNRDKDTCKDARCLAKEINNGHGLHHTSLLLSKEVGNKVRLTWDSPVMDDGSGEATGYTIWRRAANSADAFVMIGKTDDTHLTFVDGTAGAFEYEVTFTIAP